jgi:hypothetical protein
MHGQFTRSLDEKLVDKEQSYRWLKFGDIKGETGSRVVAAQDQPLSTNCFKEKFWSKKLKVTSDCVRNAKKLLIIVPFW